MPWCQSLRFLKLCARNPSYKPPVPDAPTELTEHVLTHSSSTLLLKVTSPQSLPPALSQALASLQGDRDETGWIRLKNGEPWEVAVRAACLSSLPPGWVVTILCELPLEPDDRRYRRLWDRTEDLAGALADWRLGMADWPQLEPGELVRLSPAGAPG